MDKSFNDYMDTCCDLPDTANIKKAFSKFMFYFESSDSGCNSMYDHLLEGFGKFTNLDGNYNIELKQDFFSIVEVLLKDIPDGVIHLSKPVTCVQWQQNGEVSEIVDESSSVQSPNSSSEGADAKTDKKNKESTLDENDNQNSKSVLTEFNDASKNTITEEQDFESSGINVHKETGQPEQKSIDISPNIKPIKPEGNNFEDAESITSTGIRNSAFLDARSIPKHENQNSGNTDTSSNTGTKTLAVVHATPSIKYEHSGKSDSSSDLGMVKAEPKPGSPRAVILCDDGTKYEADHVIVTPSLGFLKSNHLKFFSPPLPARRQLMIENAGFGVVDKVFLVWEEPFWDTDFAGWQFLWLDDCPVHVPSAKTCLKTSVCVYLNV